ncbi:MAG: hypothetical protein ACRDXF_03475, partial [Acidimicrobiia bacterium]
AKDPVSRPETAGAFAATLTGSATMVMAATPMAPPVTLGSEEPTVLTERRSSPTPQTVPAGAGRVARWPLLVLLLAVIAVAAAAMTDDPGDGGEELAAVTTTMAPVITTVPPPPSTTTTIPTTTTVPTTTTTVVTAESVAGEIGVLLGVLGPPEFRPRDVRQVEDRIDRILEEWASDDREDLSRELERAFEEVADLEESPERDELTDRLIQLSELMGYRVDQIGPDDDEDDGGG